MQPNLKRTKLSRRKAKAIFGATETNLPINEMAVLLQAVAVWQVANGQRNANGL